MKHAFICVALLATAVAVPSKGALAQAQDIPGGATAKTVYCLQAGDLKSGAFVGTYLQASPGAWEERLKAGTFKLAERNRDDLTVEFIDTSRSASVQFDFVNRTVKYKAGAGNWTDRYYILNATDQAGSTDCAALAALSAPNDAGAGGAGGGGPGGGARSGGGGGGGGGGSRNAGPPAHPTNVFVIMPGTKLDIAPGTKFTATSGPPCPGAPGMFLCPNKFSCAPIGGVCCPGAGSCNAGMFCDFFVPGCVAPGDARFCPGTANFQGPGTSLHCAPGQTCIANNQCQ